MLCSVCQLKILWPVVSFIAIDVVHKLTRAELPAKNLLHDVSVFTDLDAIYLNGRILAAHMHNCTLKLCESSIEQ